MLNEDSIADRRRAAPQNFVASIVPAMFGSQMTRVSDASRRCAGPVRKA
jgi:hypothetical protein